MQPTLAYRLAHAGAAFTSLVGVVEGGSLPFVHAPAVFEAKVDGAWRLASRTNYGCLVIAGPMPYWAVPPGAIPGLRPWNWAGRWTVLPAL